MAFAMRHDTIGLDLWRGGVVASRNGCLPYEYIPTMTTKGTDNARRLRDELTCPQCDYLLRGLEGAVVICPECGTRCDITLMMTRQWTAPWFRAPGFTKLMLPLTWLAVWSMGLVLGLLYETLEVRDVPYVSLCLYASVLVGWIALLRWVRNTGGEGKGWKLALLAHVLFAGYIVSIFALLMMVIEAFTMGYWVMAVILLAMSALPMGLLWLMRRGEKYIAKQCIKAWLNEPTGRE